MGIKPETPPGFVSVVEAASLIGCSKQKALDLVKEGLLEKTKVPKIRHWLISERSIMAYKDAIGISHKDLVRRHLELERRVQRLEFHVLRKVDQAAIAPVHLAPSYDVDEADDVLHRLSPKFQSSPSAGSGPTSRSS